MYYKITVKREGEAIVAADSAHEAMEKANLLSDDSILWSDITKTTSAELIMGTE